MDTQAVSAIAAVASAVIAVIAAVFATRAAIRSASAEEKSASAAQEAVAIERKRYAREVEQHAEATAPNVDLGETHGLRWTLAQAGRVLVGHIENHGPGSALVESMALEGP